MARKIDIELTSARPDGTWTWRVAGAKQPKGVLDGPLLPEGSKVGDVLRAEAEFELEGTVITSVQAAVTKRAEPERLQLLTDSRPFEPVTTSLVPKGARPSRDRRARPDGGDRDRGRPSRPLDRTDRPERAPGSGSDRPNSRTDRPGQTERGPRPDRGGRPDRPAHAPRGDSDGDRATRRTSGPGRERPTGPRRGDGDRAEHAPSGTARPKRLNPGNTHRNAVLEALPPEERAIAEQLLQGGIPAVRRAVQEQNAKAREEGRPEVQPDALLALAEELLPGLKGAEWRDRAEAAAKDVAELNLRDLRSIIAGADAGARDDESRILAKTLREALEARETAQRDAWIGEITTNLDEGKVTRALRVAGRPPDPCTRFPAELMQRLGDSASAAMSPDTPPDRWTALLAAVLDSPVRRAVKPVGLPTSPGDALVAAARQASGRIPALAGLLGLEMPPPPGPRRPGSRPVPPPPPRAARAAGAARPPVSQATDAPPALAAPQAPTQAPPAEQSAVTPAEANPAAAEPEPVPERVPAPEPEPEREPEAEREPAPAEIAIAPAPMADTQPEPEPTPDPTDASVADDPAVAPPDARPEGPAYSDSPVG